jgi:hypothetical protein
MAEAMPHGVIGEVFPHVFFVTGGFRFGPGLSISRNMTVVRSGGELTVINSVRLDADAERELEKLGKVAHVIRLGFFHGKDDRYYVERFGAKLWGPPRMPHPPGIAAEELRTDTSPIEGSQIFCFERGFEPEAALLLDREGGVLVTCDSYQNWTTFDGCSFLGGIMMRAMGFGPTHIGSPWAKRMGPDVRGDFDRLRELPFRHLVPAHGTVLKDEARPGLDAAIAKRFPL